MLAYVCPCCLGIIPLTLRFRSIFVCIYLCSHRFLKSAGELVTFLTLWFVFQYVCICLRSHIRRLYVCMLIVLGEWVTLPPHGKWDGSLPFWLDGKGEGGDGEGKERSMSIGKQTKYQKLEFDWNILSVLVC